MSRESSSLSSLLLRALTTPVLYGALLAFAAAHFDIPLKGTFLYPVLHHFTGAFIVLTAVTTGVMIRRSHCFTVSKDILLPALVKLLVSPLLALGLLAIFLRWMTWQKRSFFSLPPSPAPWISPWPTPPAHRSLSSRDP